MSAAVMIVRLRPRLATAPWAHSGDRGECSGCWQGGPQPEHCNTLSESDGRARDEQA